MPSEQLVRICAIVLHERCVLVKENAIDKTLVVPSIRWDTSRVDIGCALTRLKEEERLPFELRLAHSFLKVWGGPKRPRIGLFVHVEGPPMSLPEGMSWLDVSTLDDSRLLPELISAAVEFDKLGGATKSPRDVNRDKLRKGLLALGLEESLVKTLVGSRIRRLDSAMTPGRYAQRMLEALKLGRQPQA